MISTVIEIDDKNLDKSLLGVNGKFELVALLHF
jgi:hypothetical protein